MGGKGYGYVRRWAKVNLELGSILRAAADHCLGSLCLHWS